MTAIIVVNFRILHIHTLLCRADSRFGVTTLMKKHGINVVRIHLVEALPLPLLNECFEPYPMPFICRGLRQNILEQTRGISINDSQQMEFGQILQGIQYKCFYRGNRRDSCRITIANVRIISDTDAIMG